MKLTIEKVVYGGQGLARIPVEQSPHGGKRVFVPFTLPGEIVEATVSEQRRGYCVAHARQIQQPSAFRATAPCPWFGQCGGCQLQHSAYPYQVEMKRNMLTESLTRAGVRDLPAVETLTGEPWNYRNRIRLQIHWKPEFSIGYRQSRSHRLVSVASCAIAAPLLERCIEALSSLGRAGLLPAAVEEIEMFVNQDESSLLLTLWAHRQSVFRADDCRHFLAALQQQIPALAGAAVLPADKEHDPTLRPLLQWGAPGLTYRVAGRGYSVSLGSFFQINRTLLDRFVASVTAGRDGHTAWDLYAGVGLFSLPLAERFQRLIAVESSVSACKDLRMNLRGAATAMNAPVVEFLRGQAVAGRAENPDLVLLDPPRAGAGEEVCALMARCQPQRIVYVSCDPSTLGRDLATLIQSGYRLHRLQLVDMFPQTYHLETIAELTR